MGKISNPCGEFVFCIEVKFFSWSLVDFLLCFHNMFVCVVICLMSLIVFSIIPFCHDA